ncbi:MAG: hypothetical protein RLY78_810, partial [Pseudomonadota bacterium]
APRGAALIPAPRGAAPIPAPHGDAPAPRRWHGPSTLDGLLLLVAIVWGGSYSAAKLATTEVPVLQFLLLRFGLTFLVLLPGLRALARPQAQPLPRSALAGAALLGLNLLAILVCETWGVTLTTAANAAFLISLCVAFTPLCEWWLLGVRPGASTALAAALSMAGAGLLAFQHGGVDGLNRGDALVLLAALLRAVMVCLTRRHGQAHGLPALTVTAVQMGVMTLGTATALALTQGRAGWVPLPTHAGFWGAMAFLVLLCTVFAFFVQNHAAGRSSPSRVALLTGSEPLWGALIAVAWLGEPMRAQGWLGGALIVASAVWMSTRPAGGSPR